MLHCICHTSRSDRNSTVVCADCVSSVPSQESLVMDALCESGAVTKWVSVVVSK